MLDTHTCALFFALIQKSCNFTTLMLTKRCLFGLKHLESIDGKFQLYFEFVGLKQHGVCVYVVEKRWEVVREERERELYSEMQLVLAHVNPTVGASILAHAFYQYWLKRVVGSEHPILLLVTLSMILAQTTCRLLSTTERNHVLLV